MSEDGASRVKSRGPWTYVQKVRSGKQSLYISVTSAGDPPREAVELAGGVCGKARCARKPLCYRQIRFNDGHRGYEFSCAEHRDGLAGKK